MMSLAEESVSKFSNVVNKLGSGNVEKDTKVHDLASHHRILTFSFLFS